MGRIRQFLESTAGVKPISRRKGVTGESDVITWFLEKKASKWPNEINNAAPIIRTLPTTLERKQRVEVWDPQKGYPSPVVLSSYPLKQLTYQTVPKPDRTWAVCDS